MPVACTGAGAWALTSGWAWRLTRWGTAWPIGRPWYSTSMRVRSNGLNSRSTLRPDRPGSTSYRLPTVRHRRERGHGALLAPQKRPPQLLRAGPAGRSRTRLVVALRGALTGLRLRPARWAR